jgi:hypothetical protein
MAVEQIIKKKRNREKKGKGKEKGILVLNRARGN